MKKLLICLFLTAFCCVNIYADDLPPKIVPPSIPSPGTEPYSPPVPYNLAPEQVSVVIEVYNDKGTLIYTEKRIVSLDSHLEINTDNWKKGNYTAYVKVENAVIKIFTISANNP